MEANAPPSRRSTTHVRDRRKVWRSGYASSIQYLIDGAEYFKHLYHDLLGAKQWIYISGWEISSHVNLAPDQSQPWEPIIFENLIRSLVEHNANLKVQLLIWDSFPFFVNKRQGKSELRKALQHERIHLVFHRAAPWASSFHQKMVILDGATAYTGGMDIVNSRWSLFGHKHSLDQEEGLSNHQKISYHDVQLRVCGPIVSHLVQLARMDWKTATHGELIENLKSPIEPKPLRAFSDDNWTWIEVSRTRAPYWRNSGTFEIEKKIISLIDSAQKSIYIEHQYLTSKAILQSLKRTLEKAVGPEIIIFSTAEYFGWWENKSLGSLRSEFIKELNASNAYDRFGIFSIDGVGGRARILIHSKIMIVDGEVVATGSANLTNRSLGLDSESMLTVWNRLESKKLLISLLGEHLDATPEEIHEQLNKSSSLLDVIRSRLKKINSESGTQTDKILYEIRPGIENGLSRWFIQRKWSDPSKPFWLEEKFYQVWKLLYRLSRKYKRAPLFKRIKKGMLIAFVLFIIYLVFRQSMDIPWGDVWTDLRQYNQGTLLRVLVLTLISYACFVNYDLMAIRHLKLNLPRKSVALVAFISYAFNLSVGVIFGGVSFRFFLYSKYHLRPSSIAQIIWFSVLTNWMGYIFICGLSLSFWPEFYSSTLFASKASLEFVGFSILGAFALGYLVLPQLRGRRIQWSAAVINVSNRSLFKKQLLFSTSNWLVMAILIAYLLPDRIAFMQILATFLLSSVAALLAHIPAGIGVLETIFILNLGGLAKKSEVVAALLVFRLMYYVVPLLVASGLLVWIWLSEKIKSIRIKMIQ